MDGGCGGSSQPTVSDQRRTGRLPQKNKTTQRAVDVSVGRVKYMFMVWKCSSCKWYWSMVDVNNLNKQWMCATDLFTLRKLRKKPTNFGANYASTKMEPKYETLRLKTTEIKTPVSSKELSVFDRSQQGWLRPVSVPTILIAPLT